MRRRTCEMDPNPVQYSLACLEYVCAYARSCTLAHARVCVVVVVVVVVGGGGGVIAM